ncbi:MAG: nucleotidyl transferase AbiEii/AbiGii toxin family protein [Marinicellaceae bacterium]
MSTSALQIEMLSRVASALGDLTNDVVFVGGCVTGLLVEDSFTLEHVRFTEDVDLIVNIMTQADWNQLQSKLRKRGFKENMEDTVICRMRLGGLKVDFMPIEKDILGFTNQWYKGALKNPVKHKLTDEITINVISPEYFIATKIVAYEGRGNNDLLMSHDIEDVLTIFDGRVQIVEEINAAEDNIRKYIKAKLKGLMQKDSFEYVIQSVSRNNMQREKVIFDRIQACLVY